MAILIDVEYLKQREALLPYEDARFSSLMASVPDYYPTQNDYTLYGSFLRALAEELARLEYMYSYDIVSRNPSYLTPPDMRRRWADPLFIDKSYPTSTQMDVEYRNMLAALLLAYPEGSKLTTLEAIIQAYTGTNVVVQELYKLIGNGVYTESDHNVISVIIDVSMDPNPLEGTQSTSYISNLSVDLYSALDLAKPAHIGMDFTLTFGVGEDLSSLTHGIIDTFSYILDRSDGIPLPDVFTVSPFEDPDSPHTELSAYGKLVGDYFAPTITEDQYTALMSDDFRAEYTENGQGGYSLLPGAEQDVIVLDVNNNPTGVISRARGVLAPQMNTSWEIKGEEVTIHILS